MLEVAMAHGQHTTRRAFFKGAVAAIAVANVAGAVVAASATAATEVFPTPDMVRMAAEGMIQTYGRYGVRFIPQPDGRVFKSIYVGEDNPYDHDAVTGLDKRMEDWPELRRAVLDRVREIHAA
jgi:hypothetical protein